MTEFSWDSNPPDPKRRAAPRCTRGGSSEAMQQMWKAGIDLVAWLELRDFPYPDNPVQAGLWYRGGPRLACDEAKTPLLNSFRFPFTAYRQKRKISVWGRTPTGRGGKVVVERITPKGWKKLGTLRADGTGIFKGRVHLPGREGALHRGCARAPRVLPGGPVRRPALVLAARRAVGHRGARRGRRARGRLRCGRPLRRARSAPGRLQPGSPARRDLESRRRLAVLAADGRVLGPDDAGADGRGVQQPQRHQPSRLRRAVRRTGACSPSTRGRSGARRP